MLAGDIDVDFVSHLNSHLNSFRNNHSGSPS